MRRLVVSSFIVVFIVAICAFSLVHLSGIQREVLSRLETIEKLVEAQRLETASEESGRLFDYFKEKEVMLIYYIGHGHLAELEATFARLRPLTEQQDLAELSAELAKAKMLMEKLLDHEIPSLESVF